MSTIDLNFNLTEEQELLKKTAKDFAEVHLEPGVIERDDKSITPVNDIKEMGPVRLSEIQSAQKRILTVAKQLSDNGSDFFAANRNKETYA